MPKAHVDPALIGFRAENLAKVILTRHPGVAVISEPVDFGYDLLVTTPRGQGRIFAVQIKATLNASAFIFERSGNIREPALKGMMGYVKNSPFPVAIMILDVKTDQAYAGWLLAPASSPSSPGARLRIPAPLHVVVATDPVIRAMLAEVEAWYDDQADQPRRSSRSDATDSKAELAIDGTGERRVKLHVVPHPEGWAIRREGARRLVNVVPTKGEALTKARASAQQRGGKVVIHGKDGSIQKEQTYTNVRNAKS